MNLTKGIPINLPHVKGMVFGGPFRQYVPGTRRLFGVKMAVEIDAPADVYIDTEDFSVPTVSDMQAGIIKTLELMSQGQDAYSGCMGGIGRTGLFMACMAKSVAAIQDNLGKPADCTHPGMDPVSFVRKHYIPHAVETQGQKAYVMMFDTGPIEDWYQTKFFPIFQAPKPPEDTWMLRTLRSLGF